MTRFLFELFEGLIIGAGAILPGISGASLAVVFGLYEEFMELVAHPFGRAIPFLRRHGSLAIGIGAGFIVFTLLLDRLFSGHTIALVWLFSGFIAGTLPGIYRQARRHGVGPAEFTAFAITAGTLAALALLRHSGIILAGNAAGETASALLAPAGNAARRLTPITGFLSGAIIGTGSLMPGMSASFILIALGWYGPLLDTLHERNLYAGLFLAAGALTALAVFSRLISALYHRFHGVVSFAVLGFTLGSLILIFPGFPPGVNAIECAFLGIAGFAASLWLEKRQG
jgi:putative membrane protein